MLSAWGGLAGLSKLSPAHPTFIGIKFFNNCLAFLEGEGQRHTGESPSGGRHTRGISGRVIMIW
jgi:hypothetical protein